MDPKRNDPPKNPQGDDKKPKNLLTTIIISIAILLAMISVFNFVNGSKYTETTFSEFIDQMDANNYKIFRYADAILLMAEAYYEANKESLEESGITKTSKLVDVRHILLMPEGGTTDESGKKVYSDAEWEACRVEAQKILDQWKAEGATEEAASFLTIAEPIIPHLIAFVVFFIIALGLFLATGVMAAIKDNRKPVMLMSVAGLVICFICIVIGRFAFDKI